MVRVDLKRTIGTFGCASVKKVSALLLVICCSSLFFIPFDALYILVFTNKSILMLSCTVTKEKRSPCYGRLNVAARLGSLARLECKRVNAYRTDCLLQLCFFHDVDQLLFSKLLLDNTDAGTLLEWCKVNRGAFVVVR